MTLVVLWRSGDELNVAADTRIANIGSRGGMIALTDQGPKIFSTPVTALDAGKKKRSRTYPSVGFAYAGGTLIAQSVHAMASICLQNLTGPIDKPGPSMKEIADLYLSCAVAYTKEMSALQGSLPIFECFVFGWCPKIKDLLLYHLHLAKEGENLVFRHDGHHVPPAKAFHIGSGRDEYQKIADEQSVLGPPDPFTIFEMVLRSQKVQTVGGSRQYAVADRLGVKLLPAMVPQKGEELKRIEVLGFEITPFGQVGEYEIAHTLIGPHPDNPYHYG